jgi:hypothetical protein
VWSHGSDVYATAAGMRNSAKVSLHASGDWRFSTTEKFAREDAEGWEWPGGRVLKQWRRRRAAGVLNALSIFIPGSELRPMKRRPSEKQGIYWHPPPGDSAVTVFSVMYLPPQAEAAAGWPGMAAVPNEGLARFELASGEHVWIVVQDVALEGWHRDALEQLHSDWEGDVPADIDELRASGLVEAFGDGLWHVFEAAALPAHIRPGQNPRTVEEDLRPGWEKPDRLSEPGWTIIRHRRASG